MKRAFALAVVALAAPCHAAIYEFTFGGPIAQVQGSPPAPWNTVALSDAFSLHVRFDSLAPDAVPAQDWWAEYPAEITNVTVGGVAQASLSATIVVIADIDETWYRVLFAPSGGGEGWIQLHARDNHPFATDALPVDLDVSMFDSLYFGMTFADAPPGQDPNNLFGLVTSFSSQAVPTPGGVALFGCAMTMLRRRKRS